MPRFHAAIITLVLTISIVGCSSAANFHATPSPAHVIAVADSSMPSANDGPPDSAVPSTGDSEFNAEPFGSSIVLTSVDTTTIDATSLPIPPDVGTAATAGPPSCRPIDPEVAENMAPASRQLALGASSHFDFPGDAFAPLPTRKTEPNSLDDRINFHLAIALAHSGDLDQGYAHFATVIGPAAASFNLGVICYEHGDMDASRHYFEQARDADHDLIEARVWLRRLMIERQSTASMAKAPATTSIKQVAH